MLRLAILAALLQCLPAYQPRPHQLLFAAAPGANMLRLPATGASAQPRRVGPHRLGRASVTLNMANSWYFSCRHTFEDTLTEELGRFGAQPSSCKVQPHVKVRKLPRLQKLKPRRDAGTLGAGGRA